MTTKRLACEVRASFWFLKRVSEQCQVKNDHQAPPALPCLGQKNFLLPPDSIFACQNIQVIQHEKMVAYTWALQFWVEKVNLPTGGKPHLLVGSMIELWEEMECYLSFSDEDVFKGVTLPEETPIIPPEEVTPKSAQPTPAATPVREAVVEMTMEPPTEKRPPNKFLGWGESATPLQTHSCCQRDVPLIERPKEKAP